MDRARRAGWTALIVVVLIGAVGGLGGRSALAGLVAWPPSTLVVSEVQTGGASASDEFVELANQGATTVDLAGLEVVYATSSGSTVTRKATWTASTILEPGRRILLANAAGIHAAFADLTYSGGFAATGGAVVLRVVGGAAIDAIGWGDATTAFVEGAAAPAPPAGSSLERRPGGSGGNGQDTNDNATDWFVQATPSPQGVAAGPVPSPGPTASPTAAPFPTAAPTPTVEPSVAPTAAPTASPTAWPTADPTSTAAATPSPTISPRPTPTVLPTVEPSSTPVLPTIEPSGTPVPTPTPATSPSSTPTPSPTATVSSIAEARGLVDGSSVTIGGVLTTALGALEGGRTGFVQDVTGGISLYLDAPVVAALPAGTTVTVAGVVDSRYAQRTLRISGSAVVAGSATVLPDPIATITGEATEAAEGVRIRVSGTVTEAPVELADGLAITIDDGSGPARAVIGPDALAGRTVEAGMLATVSGPLGQRDSSGTGAAGYRIHATLVGELELAAPEPTPAASPTSTPDLTPSPAPTGAPTLTPGPTSTLAPTTSPTTSPSPAPTAHPSESPPAALPTIAEARSARIGTRVAVRGVVMAEAGRLGTPQLLAIGDATGGLVVRLPAGSTVFRRGVLLEVTGKLAAPYGQLEIRPSRSEIRALGTGELPAPLVIGTGALGEGNEGRLVSTAGRLARKPTRTAGGDVTLILERGGGAAVKVTADATSRITVSSLRVGTPYRIAGIVGQRASRSGALDGYRIWVRDPADLVADTTPGPSGSPAPSPSMAILPIARALKVSDRDIAIEAVVTAPATLLDSTGRRIVVQDVSGAVELLVPNGPTAPPIGTRIRAAGRIGVAYGAPRLRADDITILASGQAPAPLVLRGVPGAAQEWSLVAVTGSVTSVHKLADRWRAEIHVGTHDVVVVGQPGAGIASTTLVEGRTATVTGIARRPYPNATDRRFAVTPRFAADVRVAGAAGAAGQTGTTTAGIADPASGAGLASPSPGASVDADVVDLDALVGRTVRIGGLVVDLTADGFTIDDGTATGRVVLRGAAREILALVEPDDALNAIGRVESSADGPVVVVEDPGAVIRAGDPVAADPSPDPDPVASGAALPDPQASVAAAGGGRLAGLGDGLWRLDPGAAGLAALLAISAASVVVSLLRREHARRRSASRIARRLATFAGRSAPPAGGGPAERGPSTIHSA